MEKMEIKCPKCKKKPSSGDLWICSCQHIWDTFQTGGHCPKCNKIWEDTSCPKCSKWSKHIAWYSDFDKLLKRELNSLEKKNSTNDVIKKG